MSLQTVCKGLPVIIADKIIGGQGLLPPPTPPSIFWRDCLNLWYRAIIWTQELAWFHRHLHMLLLLEKKSVWKRELRPRQHVQHPPRAVFQPALLGAGCCQGSAATDPLLGGCLPASPSHSNLLPPTEPCDARWGSQPVELHPIAPYKSCSPHFPLCHWWQQLSLLTTQGPFPWNLADETSQSLPSTQCPR